MVNQYLGFAIDIGFVGLFFGESFEVFSNSLYECHVLWFLGIDVWKIHHILFEMHLLILGVHNFVAALAIIQDEKPHLFYLWYAKGISNSLLFDIASNGPEP